MSNYRDPALDGGLPAAGGVIGHTQADDEIVDIEVQQAALTTLQAQVAAKVTTVTAADSTVVVGGTATAPTVARAAITGDVTVASGSTTSALASVVTAATVGSSTLIPVITYDAKGRITGTTTAAAAAGGAVLDTTATDIVALGTQAAGATGKAADAGHVHPTTGLLLAANNLSDVTAATARTNLGLGTAAQQPTTAFDAAGAATAAQNASLPRVVDWQATTAYVVGQVVDTGGLLYRCLTAHTSGASFSGVGVNWALLGPVLADTGAWQATHAYTIAQTFTNGGLRYYVTTGYTSGATFGATDTTNSLILGAQASASGNPALPSGSPAATSQLVIATSTTTSAWVRNNFNVLAFGAKGDGTTDDTAAIQSAINAAVAANGCAYFPVGTYKITATLTVTGACSLRGESMSAVYNGIATGTGIDAQNLPVAAPFLAGAVINMRTAATDAFQLTGKGVAVNVYDLGVLFGTSGDTVIMQNTGHGFNVIPPAYSAHQDQGLMGANWANVMVYGHDGNHYAYNFVNTEYCTFTQLQAFGGGGAFEDTNVSYDGSPGGYGNNTWTNPYFVVCAAGTSHGVERNKTAYANSTQLLECWIRPQIWMWKPNGTCAGLTLAGPSSSQLIWKEDNGASIPSQIFACDFETNVAGGSQFSTGAGQFVGGWYFGANVTSTLGYISTQGGDLVTLTAAGGIAGANKISVYQFTGSISGYHAPTANWQAQAGLGTSPPGIVSYSSVIRGGITFGTGTSPAAGIALQCTMSSYNLDSTSAVPVICPTNAATAALQPYVHQINATYWQVGFGVAPAASQPNTTYGLTYIVVY